MTIIEGLKAVDELLETEEGQDRLTGSMFTAKIKEGYTVSDVLAILDLAPSAEESDG